MASSRSYIGVLAVAGVLALTPASDATTLLHMNLADLAKNAHRIYRGEVLSVRNSTLRIGGGDLPIHIYRVRVDEAFKGDFAVTKGEGTFVEVKMVAAAKSKATAPGIARVSLFRDVPELLVGRDYVLFTTTPSAVGLSTTVGLGQGAFSIVGKPGEDQHAVNGFGNQGLTLGRPDLNLPNNRPVPYRQLAQAIRAVLSE